MTDNGARALAERLHAAILEAGVDCDHDIGADCDAMAAAILANGAAFLPDAAELDRLRRIEAAARAFTTDDYTWDREAQGGDPSPVLRRLLQPEGSAGGLIEPNCDHNGEWERGICRACGWLVQFDPVDHRVKTIGKPPHWPPKGSARDGG